MQEGGRRFALEKTVEIVEEARRIAEGVTAALGQVQDVPEAVFPKEIDPPFTLQIRLWRGSDKVVLFPSEMVCSGTMQIGKLPSEGLL